MKGGVLLANEQSDSVYFERVVCPGSTQAILFLHGLAGSRRNWRKQYRQLAHTHTLYCIDLLGYGLSAKPNTNYTLHNHVEAIRQFVQEEVHEQALTVVGHSLGAVIALAYQQAHPKTIQQIFLLSLPYYHDVAEAKRQIQNAGHPGAFLTDSPALWLLCTIVCRFGRPLSSRIVPLFMKDLPADVVQDSFLHTYNSYISTLYNVIYDQHLPELLAHCDRTLIQILHGENDRVTPLTNIQQLASTYDLNLSILANEGHMFPIVSPDLTVNLLQHALSGKTAGQS